jgi:cell division protein ZapA (FtsZ GTPase activity inhibitor)
VKQAPLAIRIAGRTYRIQSTASPAEVQGYARLVEAKLHEIAGERPITPDTWVLVALALVHDAAEEKQKRKEIQVKFRDWLRRVLFRIDALLESSPDPDAVLSILDGVPEAPPTDRDPDTEQVPDLDISELK